MRASFAFLLPLACAPLLLAGLQPIDAGLPDRSVVTVEAHRGGYRLVRNGEPYFVKGAGGQDHLEELADAGGNSIRTWSTGRSTKKLLDEAHRHGLTVTLGVWLRRTGDGIDYSDAKAMKRQADKVRSAVERFKDHPALLMWAIGNEMEGDGNDPDVYAQLESLAQLVHELDPHHPAMTVIADLGGGKKVRDLNRFAPSIDIVGINSYGAVGSVPERYRSAGGKRPYVITEFGTRGHWESPRTAWGTPIELSSTEKAELYREGHTKAVGKEKLCVGAYAFLWGNKQETTATWYGMLLPDGTRLGCVDAMSEIWTGEAPENRCPEINSLKLTADRVKVGSTFTATLKAKDPDKDRLEVEWVLRSASDGNGSYGGREDQLDSFPRSILTSKPNRAKVRAPDKPGPYRLFAYVRDGEGGAAVHNLPLLVEARQ